MWKCEYNIFNLPHDYEVNDYTKIWVGANFGSCRYCRKEDITILISYITSREHVIRELCDFLYGFPLP